MATDSIDWTRFPIIDGAFLGELAPIETYLYYDGPRSWSAKDTSGDWYYVHQADENNVEGVWELIFLAVKMTREELDRLEANQLALRDALSRDPVYVVAMSNDNTPYVVRLAVHTDIPDDCLPQAGVTFKS